MGYILYGFHLAKMAQVTPIIPIWACYLGKREKGKKRAEEKRKGEEKMKKDKRKRDIMYSRNSFRELM